MQAFGAGLAWCVGHMKWSKGESPKSLFRERCELSRTPVILMLGIVVGMHMFQRWRPLNNVSTVLVWGVLGLALLQIIVTLNVVRRRRDAFRRAMEADNLLCPFCTYDLRGIEQTVRQGNGESEIECPECGADVRVNDLAVAWDQEVQVSEVRAWVDSKERK